MEDDLPIVTHELSPNEQPSLSQESVQEESVSVDEEQASIIVDEVLDEDKNPS